MMASTGFTAKLDALGIVRDCAARATETHVLAARYLDPSLIDVLRILGFDRDYAHARGSRLFDSAGRAYLDFHTGEGFASLGHNHPDVREALHATLDADLVDGVQIHYSVLAGLLAEELTRRLPAGLDAVFFTSTGAEAVDSALKFARAATGRARLVSCDSGFHGVTLGPLSLVGDEFFKQGFGPLLPGCARVPFGDLAALKAQLERRDVAAFICEPIQGRKVSLPPPGYLEGAQALCLRYGTLFILDEIQTGLGRTGKLFALEHWGLEPDFVLVGKALSGGYMPVAAMVTRRKIYDEAVGTLDRCYVHQSTYGRNRLAMAAGLAALRIIERDGLIENSARMGRLLLDGLSALQAKYEMLREVRGEGLMLGIELGAPRSPAARASWRLIHLASEGLFPQLIVIPLHRDHGIITMAAGKNDVIKLLPPLTLSEPEARTFLDAFEAVLADVHGPSSKNWGVVKDIAMATLRRRSSAARPQAAARRGKPIDPSGADVCLVTGASGFIGGHVAERLVQAGYQVRCLVRATSDTALVDSLGVELAVGDLSDAASLAAAMEGCRYVIHCAAQVTDWGTVQELVQVNVKGTTNLLEAAAQASVDRFVHVSTTDIYGYPDAAGVDEDHPPPATFENWYAETKRAAEAEVRRFERERALPVVILRPATVYGPRSLDLVQNIAGALRGGYMLLVDGGRAVAGLAYVDNVVDAALLALRHDQAPGQAFNVGDGLALTWRQFTDDLARGLGCDPARFDAPYWLANAVGFSLETGYRLLRQLTRLHSAPLLTRQAVHVLGTHQDFSIQKARARLGWTPRVDYETGLAATLSWLKAARDRRRGRPPL
jgi:ornithine--oxo-acid transaminase